MTPFEIASEEAAEWVRELLNTHWTVWLLPILAVATFLIGLFLGRRSD